MARAPPKKCLFISRFLPDGEDPDSLVRQEGQDGFEKRLKEAMPLSEFVFTEQSIPAAGVRLNVAHGPRSGPHLWFFHGLGRRWQDFTGKKASQTAIVIVGWWVIGLLLVTAAAAFTA